MRPERLKKRIKSLDEFSAELDAPFNKKESSGVISSLDSLQIPKDNESAKKFSEELEKIIEDFNKKIDDDSMDLNKYVLKNKVMLLEKTKKIIDEYLKAQLDICTPRGFEVLGTLLKISGELVTNIERSIPAPEPTTLPGPPIAPALNGPTSPTNILILSTQEMVDQLVEKTIGIGNKKISRDTESHDKIIDSEANPK